ncbi:MAG: hypothetical protein WEB57_02270 [Pseudohongiellaceae bacterium]
MKVILVNERLGHTRTYVIKGWLKGVLSLCLLGAPVALGYLGYQLSLQQTGPGQAAPYDAAVHHSLRGAPGPAELQLSDRDAVVPVPVAPRSAGDWSSGLADSRMIPVAALKLSTAAPAAHYPVQPARHLFRNGRSVDPASYQRRVYS